MIVDSTLESLVVLAHALGEIRFDPERCAAALDRSLYATEKAIRLTRDGVPWREAYRRVAKEL